MVECHDPKIVPEPDNLIKPNCSVATHTMGEDDGALSIGVAVHFIINIDAVALSNCHWFISV